MRWRDQTYKTTTTTAAAEQKQLQQQQSRSSSIKRRIRRKAETKQMISNTRDAIERKAPPLYFAFAFCLACVHLTKSKKKNKKSEKKRPNCNRLLFMSFVLNTSLQMNVLWLLLLLLSVTHKTCAEERATASSLLCVYYTDWWIILGALNGCWYGCAVWILGKRHAHSRHFYR